PAAMEKGLSWLDRGNIRSQARTAKERLTDQRSYDDTYNLEGLGFVDLSLDVEKFEGLLENSGLVERSLKVVHEALKLALALDGACQSDLFNVDIFRKTLPEAGQFIQRVIPVGGITKIPYIRRRLAEVFGESKIVSENIIEPIMAVAIGAAFKKEKEHFSISVPPFGFTLQFGNDSNRSEEQTISLVKPFEYYEFYKSIASNALPIHSTAPLTIDGTYYDCRLLLEYANGRKGKEFSRMGNLHEGDYEFSIALNGDVYLNRLGDTLISRGQIPYLHPLQERISKERENRANKRRKDMDAKRNDSMISMTWEN
ncbi:MAG TPA: hypothetical protein VMT91_08855, partial [Anaerolineales bacterium]|nr:hypothetical protein [Anaerolineales bacterium]